MLKVSPSQIRLVEVTRTGFLTRFAVIYRDAPGVRIPGGSEDVMFDLAVRQLVKLYQVKTRVLSLPKI